MPEVRTDPMIEASKVIYAGNMHQVQCQLVQLSILCSAFGMCMLESGYLETLVWIQSEVSTLLYRFDEASIGWRQGGTYQVVDMYCVSLVASK